MRIEPANVNQVRLGENGRMLEIDQDIGRVAEDLRRIDPGLKVRFAESANPPFWAVYHESERNGRVDQYLVLTAQAHLNASGAWEGLDQRVVRRVEEIGHASYDYAGNMEAHNRQVGLDRRKESREKLEQLAELSAHAIRRDLGGRYKGRAYIAHKL